MDYPRRLPPQAEPKVTRSRFPRGRRHPGAGAFLPSRGPARPSRRPDPRVLPTCCGRSGCRGGRAALPETDALRSPRRGPALHSRGQRRSWERVINRLRGCGAGRCRLDPTCGYVFQKSPGSVRQDEELPAWRINHAGLWAAFSRDAEPEGTFLFTLIHSYTGEELHSEEAAHAAMRDPGRRCCCCPRCDSFLPREAQAPPCSQVGPGRPPWPTAQTAKCWSWPLHLHHPFLSSNSTSARWKTADSSLAKRTPRADHCSPSSHVLHQGSLLLALALQAAHQRGVGLWATKRHPWTCHEGLFFF
ncbi:uncharacterized protein LOC116481766 isoform X1 [Hylobates moloch]|uniref:uncharacterized protein LOC116481766 isoform X1 n=1 Tax=Hylobates moloch TaxID=81572 RepID=UPI0013645EED|nr:uncharacterized protein LOC116481766 isoform X1 [Hylobates moloch]